MMTPMPAPFSNSFETLRVDVSLPISYRYIPAHDGTAKETVVLLHGYAERAERILRLLADAVPKSANILVPNAPFPVPIQREAGWKEAYSWYFYDPSTRSMVVSPETAIQAMKYLIHQRLGATVPLRLVGFSQGGYFAPLLAQALPQVRQAICIAAQFPARYYPERPGMFRLDAINGALDEVCPLETSKAEFSALTSRGWSGEFVSLPETAHRIDDAVRAQVARLLALPLRE